MAKRTDIKKVLIIGSGPIVIGQAAEFDYAGTQACLALKEEGYEVVLVNSNPATIMTDTSIADKVYMEPLTLEYVAKILRYERPDAIVPGIGGQTGLNMAMQLERKGILRECGTKLLGTSSESIERAEDRELFKEMCLSIGEPVIPSEITYNLEEARAAAARIGYPVVLRPAFTLGGTGGGFAYSEQELNDIGANAFKLSPVHEVLVEKSVKGYKEIEFEVMRDSNDTAITICGMENVDPVGVHTGDSIVVAPILSLSEHDLKMLNDSAIKIIRELKIAERFEALVIAVWVGADFMLLASLLFMLRRLAADPINAIDDADDLLRAIGQHVHGIVDRRHILIRLLNLLHYALELRPDIADGLRPPLHAFPAGQDAFDRLLRITLNDTDALRNLPSCLLGCLGQLTHLIGHHGEPSSLLASTCSLNRRIEREQVCLLRDARDRIDHLPDFLGAVT